jgi:putative adhesin
MTHFPLPQHQPPEGTYPGWPPSPPTDVPYPGWSPPAPPPGGYPPYGAPHPYSGGPYAPRSRGNAGWIVGGCVAVAVILLAGCVVVTYAFGQIMRASLNQLTNTVTVHATNSQQFSVSGAPTIQIDVSSGSVVVRGGAAGAVTVESTVSATAGSTAAAQRDLRGVTVTATQAGNTITIRTSESGGGSPFFPRTADLVITVPATSNVSANLEMGTVTMSSVAGLINTTVQAGDFNAQGLTLQDGSRISVDFGSVLLDATLAPGASASVTVQRGQATLTLPGSTAAHLSAIADTGDVSISGWNVPIQQQGSGASASGDLGTGGTGTLSVHVVTGSIVMSARQ